MAQVYFNMECAKIYWALYIRSPNRVTVWLVELDCNMWKAKMYPVHSNFFELVSDEAADMDSKTSFSAFLVCKRAS